MLLNLRVYDEEHVELHPLLTPGGSSVPCDDDALQHGETRLLAQAEEPLSVSS